MVLFATIDFIQPEPVLISFLTMHNDLASINLLYANNSFTVNRLLSKRYKRFRRNRSGESTV